MVAMKAMKAGARAMTGGVLTKKIAESTQLKTKDVKGVLAALQTIACAEVKKTEKFAAREAERQRSIKMSAGAGSLSIRQHAQQRTGQA